MNREEYTPKVLDPAPSDEKGALDYEIVIRCVFRCERGEYGADASIFRRMGEFYKPEVRREAETEVSAYLKNALQHLKAIFPEYGIEEYIDKCMECLREPNRDNIYTCMYWAFKALDKIYPDIIYSMVSEGRYDEARFV